MISKQEFIGVLDNEQLSTQDEAIQLAARLFKN